MVKLFIRIIAFILVATSSVLLYDRWMITDHYSSLSPIDPMPYAKELIDNQHFAEAEEYLGYFIENNSSAITPQTTELIGAIHKKRQSWEYRAKKILQGAIDGESDETEGVIGAGVADLFVVGDIRDIIKEGANWLNGDEVDEIVLALSSMGVAATAATIGSAGGAGGVKGSISLLKQMRKGKLLPAWLAKRLTRLSKAGDLKKESNAILEPISSLYREGGLFVTRDILRSSKSLKELKEMKFFVKKFGRKSSVLLKLEPKAMEYATHLPVKTVTRASLYGKPAFKQLARRIKYSARITKVISKSWQKILRTVPLTGLIIVWIASLYLFFFPKLLPLIKKS